MTGEQRAEETEGQPSGPGGNTALRGALVSGTATLGSRVLGFARDALMGAFVGVTPELGAFQLAWVFPNLFRRLFGEGAVSAAILPALARAQAEGGREQSQALFARFQGVFLVGLALLVAAGELVVWLWFASSGSESTREALVFTGWLLPYLLPICLAALAGAPQHLAGRFSMPALAPAALNGVWITALLVLRQTMGFENSMPALTALSAAILAGGLVQWWMQWPALRAEGFSMRPSFRKGDGTVRRTLRAFAPALLGLAVVQINLAVDQVLVRTLVSDEANVYTHFANRLLQLPLALIAISAATGLLPLFAKLSAQNRIAELSRALRRGCESTLVVILAAGAGLYLVAAPTITVLFEHGQFTAGNTAVLTEVLRAYLWCLPAAAVSGLMTRVRQTRGDFRGPAWIAAAVVPVNLVLDLILLPRLGVAGAGFATSAALWVQAALLTAGLPSLELGLPVGIARLPRLALPAAASTAAAGGAMALLGSAAFTLPGLLAVIAAGVAAAAAVAAWLLPEETREFRATLARRKAR